MALARWHSDLTSLSLGGYLKINQGVPLLPKHGKFWHPRCLLLLSGRKADEQGGIMSLILIFASKWNRCYRVLRYSKGFGLFDSLRYGLWLARG
jgi:hypothetical protein